MANLSNALKNETTKIIRLSSGLIAHYYQLHNNLVNLNQEAGQSVNEYLVVFQPIWTQLDQAKISKDHLRLIKVLMGLRPEYESVSVVLLHRSPLPSLDAAIQEILFEEKRLGINLSKHSDVVLASTYSPPGASSTFCHILDNCPIKPPRPRSYSTRAKNFTKPRNSFVVAATSDNPTTPSNRWLLDSACCNHMTSNYSLMNTPSPTKSLPPIYAADGNCSGSADGTDDWDGSQSGKIVGAPITSGPSSFLYLYPCH
ncbi:Zinc finger, CCHC-type [Cucumis melo var. makuwa]|nr:Zinc finger, CCHC-type [Cucumis melo var. makuwa]